MKIRQLASLLSTLVAMQAPGLMAQATPRPRAPRANAAPPSQAGDQTPMMGNPASRLIEMRRALDLTPRQVAALDSIERSSDERNRIASERLRARRDSMRSEFRGGAPTPEGRQALRARLDSLAPLRQQLMRNDSVSRAAAFRVLTDSQRVRVREFEAEQRGFQRGRMTAMGGFGGGRFGGRGFGARGFGGRGFGGGAGFGARRFGRRGFGPFGFGPGGRMGRGGFGGGPMGRGGFGGGPMGQRGFRGQMGPQGMPGMRRRFPQDSASGAPGIDDRMGPGSGGRGLGPPGMRRRMMPEANDSTPADSLARRRGPRRPPPSEPGR